MIWLVDKTASMKSHNCAHAAGTNAFNGLQTMLLRDNQLSSWGDVDSLNRLVALTDLRLTGNPIVNDARGGGRYEVCFASFAV